MQKVFRVTVDISKKIPAPAFEVNTNDLKSVKLEITITNGQSLLDLTDVTPRINIRKPDNEVIFQDCEIVDAKSGKIQIILENQAYLVPGTHTAEIMCYKGSDVVAVTGTFSYKSTKGIMNDEAVESKSEFTAIDRKLIEVQEILEDARENGTGIDAQARKDLQNVTTQLAEKANKNEVQSLVTNKAEKSYVDQQINSLGQLKFEGQYDTLAALQTAKPTGATGVYLVIADGYTYRWNGSAWVKGAIFQPTGIGENAVKAANLDNQLKESLLYLITNKAVNSGFTNGTTGWATGNALSFESSNGEGTLKAASAGVTSRIYQTLAPVPGHKFYLSAKVKRSTNGPMNYISFGGAETESFSSRENEYVTIKAIVNPISTGSLSVYFLNPVANESIKVKDVLVIDLTENFGSGKEPTVVGVEEILNKFPSGWFDGTVQIASLKQIYDENKNNVKKQEFSDLKEQVGFPVKNKISNADWTSATEALTIENNKIVATIKSARYGGLGQITPIECQVDKQIFVSAKVKITNPNCDLVVTKFSGTTTGSASGTGTFSIAKPQENKEYELYGLVKLSSAYTGKFKITLVQEYADASIALGKSMEVREVMVLDVTETFGKGLEPTVEDLKEFLATKFDGGYIQGEASLVSIKDIYDTQNTFMKKANFNSLPFIMPSKTSPQRAIMTISYDDESSNIYDYAFPVHKSTNVPGIFYVVPSHIGTGKTYDWGVADTWERIREMDRFTGKGRIQIECHTYRHSNLSGLNKEEFEKDCQDAIKLFRRNGIEVNHIAYPGGYFKDVTQEISQQYFQSGRTTEFVSGINGYDLKPYTVGSFSFDNGSVAGWKSKIDQAKAENKWLSIYLHSVHPNGSVTSSDGTVRRCMTPDGLREVIEYAKSQGVETVSQEEALQTFAPIFYWIDYKADAPMVIQRNGVIANNVIGEAPRVMGGI